jgi:upstream activation factor subunit UAF30
LTQISAKTVRKSILAADASLDPDWVRNNKQGIDDLIKQIFSTISASQQAVALDQVKRKREDEDDHGPSSTSQRPNPATAAAEHATTKEHRVSTPHFKQELDDEEYARRVSAEINAGAHGRMTRGGSANGGISSAPAAKKRKNGKFKVKSPSKIVDSGASASEGSDGYDDEEDPGGDSRSKKKGAKRRRAKGDGDGGGAKGGFGKEFLLSEPLSVVCEGATQLSRPQVVKALWKYIKVSGTWLSQLSIWCTYSTKFFLDCRKISFKTLATRGKFYAMRRCIPFAELDRLTLN